LPSIGGAARGAALRLAMSLAVVAPQAVAAKVHDVSTRDEFIAALAAARPGDEIRLAPGIYRGGILHADLRGAAESPLLIAAAEPDDPPRFSGGGSALHLSSPAYVELRDLEFADAEGNGLNIDDAGATASPAHHIVLRNLGVRDVGPAGNCDGIKLSGVEDFQVIHCRIERWGDGGSGVDMVGCHRGVIEQSRLVGRGGQQANAVQIKGGSSDVVVRRCRIEDAGGRGINVGGSTGEPFFRPRDAAYEARGVTIEDCEILGGECSIAFVGVDGAVVRHNTLYRPRHWVLRILQESTGPRFVPCRDGAFTDNLVAFRSDEVRQVANIGPGTEPASFEFARNAWTCLDRPDATQRLVQLPVVERDGVYGKPPHFVDADRGDVTIRAHDGRSPGVRPE
jgi:hypothetical protein